MNIIIPSLIKKPMIETLTLNRTTASNIIINKAIKLIEVTPFDSIVVFSRSRHIVLKLYLSCFRWMSFKYLIHYNITYNDMSSVYESKYRGGHSCG